MSLAGMWRGLFTRNSKRRVAIDDAAWSNLISRSALFARLDASRQLRVHDFCEQFLARKSFSAAGGHVLDDAQCLAIAALACLPVLELGFDALDGWSEVIVYPGGFRVRREHHDEHSGVVTEGDDELIGEAWERGPVILSWADIAADLDSPFEGLNVVIHEIAHKLDMLDGAMNGVPRLPAHMSRRQWVETMQMEYDAFVLRVEAGEGTAIDPYAAESPQEFFAVIVEHYFSVPETLEDSSSTVFSLMDRLFRS